MKPTEWLENLMMLNLRNLLLPLLIPFSFLYGLLIKFRNSLYNNGIFNSIKLDVPIISVGNITLGGTGKTPMVIYIAKLLRKNGYTPGIISRGYGRLSTGPLMVHDGNKILTNATNAGDEPYLMAKELKNIPILVSNNRKIGAQQLLTNNNINVIILDDAFQHRKISRDLEIVMISSHDHQHDYHIIPWGKLREPISSLNRADCVIYTRTNNFQFPNVHNLFNQYLKNFFLTSIMKPTLMKIDNTGYQNVKRTEESVLAFCGVGNSLSFIQNSQELGIHIKEKIFFKDHKEYDKKTLKSLYNKIKNNNYKAILTTEKDMVKIPHSLFNDIRFYVIKIELVIKNENDMTNVIKSKLHLC